MPDVVLTPVKSSNLAAVGHDPARGELHVKFLSGAHHVYEGVSPEAHQALLSAPSAGSHFYHNFIKAGIKSRKLG